MIDLMPKWDCYSPVLNLHLGTCKFRQAKEESVSKNESETETEMRRWRWSETACEHLSAAWVLWQSFSHREWVLPHVPSQSHSSAMYAYCVRTTYELGLAIHEPRKWTEGGIRGNQHLCLLVTTYTEWLLWIIKVWPTCLSLNNEGLFQFQSSPEVCSSHAICCACTSPHHLFPVLHLSLSTGAHPESILSKPPDYKLLSLSLLPRDGDLGNLLHKAPPSPTGRAHGLSFLWNSLPVLDTPLMTLVHFCLAIFSHVLSSLFKQWLFKDGIYVQFISMYFLGCSLLPCIYNKYLLK